MAMTRAQAERWVDEMYRAILGTNRRGTEGWNWWVNSLVAGIHTDASSYQDFINTPEAQAKIAKNVHLAYRNVMGREPEPGAIQSWVNVIRGGGVGPSLREIETHFRSLPEGIRKMPAAGAGGAGDAPGGGGTLGGGAGGGVGEAGDDYRHENIVAQVQLILDRYGLGDMTGWVNEMLESGKTTVDEIRLELYGHERFKQRFPALDMMRSNGLSVITPEEYLSIERSMTGIMRAAGLPDGFYDDPSDFTNLIGNHVSSAELSARVQQGFGRVMQAPPEVRARFSQFFGAQGDAALASYFLDPDKAVNILEQQVSAAEIAGVGDLFGFGIGQATAQQLAELGHDMRSAQPRLQTLQGQQSLFEESVTETEDFTAEEEGIGAAFGTDAQAGRELERRARSRTGALSGGGGFLIQEGGIAGRADS